VCKKPANFYEFAQVINQLAAKTSGKVLQVHGLNHSLPSSHHRSHAKTTARKHKLWS
jgi:hypothetical protein